MSDAALLVALPAPVDLPAVPSGWESEAEQVIRIIAPDGRAAAWLAPAHGANCIGYAVRRPEGWVQVFAVEAPPLLKARPTRSGCAVLFPFPGHVRGACYRWDGIEYLLPPNSAGVQHYTHGFAQFHPWRVTRVATSAVEAEFLSQAQLADQPTGYPFPIYVHLRLCFSATYLSISLAATNLGDRPAPVGIGLHPYFSPTLFGGDRTMMRVSMPGDTEHVLEDSIPSGARTAVINQEIIPPPHGQSLLIARTNLDTRPVTRIRNLRDTMHIQIATDGCRDLLFYAPDDRSSIAVEPQSCAPGAASQPEGHPDGLVSLAPGAMIRLTMGISVQDHQPNDAAAVRA